MEGNWHYNLNTDLANGWGEMQFKSDKISIQTQGDPEIFVTSRGYKYIGNGQYLFTIVVKSGIYSKNTQPFGYRYGTMVVSTYNKNKRIRIPYFLHHNNKVIASTYGKIVNWYRGKMTNKVTK